MVGGGEIGGLTLIADLKISIEFSTRFFLLNFIFQRISMRGKNHSEILPELRFKSIIIFSVETFQLKLKKEEAKTTIPVIRKNTNLG